MASEKGGVISLIIGIIVVIAVIMTCTEKCSSKDKDNSKENNSTGSWQVGNFVDDFGSNTGKKYITQYFSGKFSKLGVQNERAYIEFTITSSDKIEFELFQYGHDKNDVRRHNDLSGALQDSNGNRYTLYARGGGRASTRNRFDSDSSKIIHDVLLKGGDFKIRLKEDYGGEEYAFDFASYQISGYANAYKQLTEN